MSPVKKVNGPSDRSVTVPKVLFVDDDEDTLTIYERLFSSEPIDVITVTSGLHALQVLRAEKIDLVVSDFAMLGMNGNVLLREVGRLYPLTGRILLTGDADSELVLDSPCRVLTKGMDPGLIRHAIVRAAYRHA